jgi:hypothetical protein
MGISTIPAERLLEFEDIKDIPKNLDVTLEIHSSGKRRPDSMRGDVCRQGRKMNFLEARLAIPNSVFQSLPVPPGAAVAQRSDPGRRLERAGTCKMQICG